MAATAARMASIAACGWDTIETCDPATSVIVEPARSAMLRWVAGGMTRSSVPITAQLGMVFQAVVSVPAVLAPRVIGRWLAAISHRSARAALERSVDFRRHREHMTGTSRAPRQVPVMKNAGAGSDY